MARHNENPKSRVRYEMNPKWRDRFGLFFLTRSLDLRLAILN